MLGMGWQEIFLVAVVAVIVVGPKELPRVLRTVSHWIAKLREMAREFQSSVEDVVREAELNDLRKELEEASRTDISETLTGFIDSSGEVADSVRSIEESVLSEAETKPNLSEGYSEENEGKSKHKTEFKPGENTSVEDDNIENDAKVRSDRLV